MSKEEALKVLDMFLHKQCDLGRTEFAYDANTVWEAVNMARKALEQEPSKEEKALLQKWRDNRGLSMKEFEEAMNALQEQEPKTEWIPILKGANNGDMMKAMFTIETVDGFNSSIGVRLNGSNYILFNKDWWNEPYKKEVSE